MTTTPKYVIGNDYPQVCAAGHTGRYEGLTNGFHTFICNGGCGPCYFGPVGR